MTIQTNQQLTPAWLVAELGDPTFARASRYARDGRAVVDESASTGPGGIRIVGTCAGSGGARYQQRVLISPVRGGPPELAGLCSCPVGFNCKHVGALVIAWLELAAGRSTSPDQVAAWLAELGATPPDDGDGPQEAVLYLLQPGSGHPLEVAVDFAVARPRRDGRWSAGRRTQIEAMHARYYRGSYLRPVDREIIDLLEVGNRQRYDYRTRLAGALGAMALEKMAVTGRAFFGADRRGPLQPGPPRSLAVRWAQTDAGYRPALDVDGCTDELPHLLTEVTPPAYIDEEALQTGPLTLPAGLSDEQLHWLLRAPPIDASRAQEVSRQLALSVPDVPTPVPVPMRELKTAPQSCLTVHLDPHEPAGGVAVLRFRYGERRSEGGRAERGAPAEQRRNQGHRRPYGQDSSRQHADVGAFVEVPADEDGPLPVIEQDDGLLRVHRDAEAEARAHRRLLATGLDGLGGALYAPGVNTSTGDTPANGTQARARVRGVATQFDAGGLEDAEDVGTTTLDGAETPPAPPAPPVSARHAWLEWWHREAPALQAEGWLIDNLAAPTPALREASGLAGEVDDDAGDWFSLRFDLEVAGERLPMLPLVSQLLEHYHPGHLPETLYLDGGEGAFVSVPSALLTPVLDTILELYGREDDEEIRLARADATRLLEFEQLPLRGATRLRRLARRLTDWSGLRKASVPTTFKGTLRPYQQQGVDWLQFLREYGFNGVLADDMGLGKTIQTLAHLTVERRAGRMDLPSLIVAPTSLMGNWRREAEQFAPKLNVLVQHGPQRDAWFEHLADFDVVVTTYPLLPRDHEHLLAQAWHYVILDEAQYVKNARAQAAQVVRALECRHRVCLTGTPMENRLSELWAHFDFLMPGFLGDAADFAQRYGTPIEKHGDEARMASLTRRIRPFLLRRTKDLVASELPPKTEVLRSATLGAAQARLYESIRLTMERRVRRAIASRGLARSHIVVLEALLKLRQVCCDPRLLPAGTSGAKRAGSAKFELLFELLPELLAEGRRVLLFSQFTTMLGLIEDEVVRRGTSYTKLTGQTRRRDEAIDRFRSGDADLFLISLKAGGTGLNLVEADTVIHYDPWWNPAVEHQATDRAHRIGQDRPVFVYKLIAEGTVEEKILALQARKQALAEAAYGTSRAPDQPPIDEEVIRELLGGN